MIVCLCGKSGSGKSTIAKLIPNSIHVDIDKIGHKSHSDYVVKEKLINTFGNSILTENKIDRNTTDFFKVKRTRYSFFLYCKF